MKTTKPMKSHELKIIREKLLEKTGCRLKDYLIEQAFTRSSYSKKFGGGSNENFEYIGDVILGYHVVRILYDHYGSIHVGNDGAYYAFSAHEKDFTALKSKIVSNHTLATVMDEWDLSQYMIVGQSDIDNDIDKQEKIKADLFEAIIGAIAVQNNWDQNVMQEVVLKALPIEEYILDFERTQFRLPEFSAENAVNTLKELAESERCSFPKYEIAGPEQLGYNESGQPRWTCKCLMELEGITKLVLAHSKKDAKKYAAYLVLCDMFEIPNEYGKNKKYPVWGFKEGRLIPNPPFDF